METHTLYKYEPGNFDLTRLQGREFHLSQTTLADTTYTLFVKMVEDPEYLKEIVVLSEIWDFVIRVKSPTRDHDISLGSPFVVYSKSDELLFVPDDSAIQDYSDDEIEDINQAHEILIKDAWPILYKTMAREKWQHNRRSQATGEVSELYDKYTPHNHDRAAYLLHFAKIKNLQTANLAISLFDTIANSSTPENWPTPVEFETLAVLTLT